MRARPALVLVAALVMTATAVVWVVTAPPAAPPVSPSAGGVSATWCAPAPPTTAADWATLFAHLGDTWLGGDGAVSVPVGPSRTLWLFGDTLTRVGSTGLLGGTRVVHNSAVLVEGACATVLRPGRDTFPASSARSWWWPLSAVVTGSGDAGALVTVFLQGVERVGWSAWSFRTTGVATTRWWVPRAGLPGVPVVRPLAVGGSGHLVLWGAGSAIAGGTAYVYGTRATGRPLEFGRELLLARADVDRLADPASWAFWTGRDWSGDPTAAAVVRPAVGGVSTALSAWSSGGRWTLVTKADEFLGDRVVALTGDHPGGPFSETVLFRAPSTATDLSYLPLAHPELSAPGRLLVTLNHNVADLDLALAEPAHTRPSFHDVASPD